MHIGFLTPEYVTQKTPDGGLANYLKKTAENLVKRGHTVTIFLMSDSDGIWYDGMVRIVEVAGSGPRQKLLRFSPPHIVSQFIDQMQSSKIIAQRVFQLQKLQPLDIIQASSYEASGNALLHNKKIPVVCRVSSYTPLWRKAYGRQKNIEDIFIEWLEFRQIKESDASYSPSEFIARIFSKKLKKKIPVIRTPLDNLPINNLDEAFYNENLKGKKYILFFGTLSRTKGADLLADVIPRVLKDRPELFFVFIGRDDGFPGGQKVHDYIINRAKPFKQQIIYHPAIKKSQLYGVILHAECVVIPSRVDNYPNACLEAQCLGIPVIGTRNSSLDEMIIDGKTGFLAQNEDTESLYTVIFRLLDLTTSEREEMHVHIREQMKKMVDEDRIGQLLVFYEKVINEYRRDI